MQFLSLRCTHEQFPGFGSEVDVLEALFVVKGRAADDGVQVAGERGREVRICAALVLREPLARLG